MHYFRHNIGSKQGVKNKEDCEKAAKIGDMGCFFIKKKDIINKENKGLTDR